MKIIVGYNEFGINESVAGSATILSDDDMQKVKSAQPRDLGDADTPVRKAILNALVSVYNYFEEAPGDDIEIRTRIIELIADDDLKNQLLDIAKTFVASLDKIRTIEINEIEPIGEQMVDIFK